MLKLARLQKRASKSYKKSVKWERQMSKAFRNTRISDISEESIAVGRDYIYMLYNDRLG